MTTEPKLPASLPQVEVEKVELRLRLDATVTVYDGTGQATDWLKPGSEGAVTWRGGIPSEAEVELGYQYLHARNAQILEEVLVAMRKRLDETRRGR
jgi:hypothetical protein